ncbi:SURF1-domain-containing protein [Metschnikowia bicuspidata var. bicuspidata NRRL YB-4993]|uniref:SURF1-like protein n=1 Tax=Metschnikowia bicuspidata var. bicuspidata NRRL YB-4993 TaxID=869754 RepID=A0A1A0HBB9_9ASCO|nr:SURF1-domain-containing protein [Metschnikowia bicuspidata var. bicuspidata NRRL YB-4993]OBA21285.1 SURF1-domain-containing protein [Metschnikowia bicuspidata var. bicuspidata NRRL YB-4993]
MQPARNVITPNIDWKPIKTSVTNLAKAENQGKARIFRGVLLGLMVAMPVISFCLGCWQVKRLKWKVELIERAEHMLAEPPLEELPALLDPSVIKDFEFRRFKVRGHFSYEQEMFLGPRLRNGEVGYLVVTPFIRASGGKPILIERGWIQQDLVMPERRSRGYLSHLALPQGEITIEGMLRVMPTRSGLQYEHEPGSRLFHVPDVSAMAEQSGTLPIYAQMMYNLRDQPDWVGPDSAETPQSGWSLFTKKAASPKAGHLPGSDPDSTLEWQEFEFYNEGVPIAAVPNVTFTNNHLQYLVTWFGVSVASTVLLVYIFMKKKGLKGADKIIQAKKDDMKKRL